jgi:hypothetical protein
MAAEGFCNTAASDRKVILLRCLSLLFLGEVIIFRVKWKNVDSLIVDNYKLSDEMPTQLNFSEAFKHHVVLLQLKLNEHKMWLN